MSSAKPVSDKNATKFRELGLNISFYRRRAGMTQEALAERVGISRAHLSAIEAPNLLRPFSIELLFEIADALAIPPSRLLEFRD